MNNQPTWKSDYPVRQAEEHAVTRRQFAKFACCSVLAFGAAGLVKDELFEAPAATEPKFVASLDEVPVGGYKLFRYPTEQHPCILVRLGETQFAAYSQSCTHLMCPVHYQHEKKQLVCPCHEGFFNAETGAVLAGPPPKPLPRFPVKVRDGQLWVYPANQNNA
ncbi:MAG: Rieske 2Fe-2S domain-containing protein [Verrucomicrobiota bacterium]